MKEAAERAMRFAEAIISLRTDLHKSTNDIKGRTVVSRLGKYRSDALCPCLGATGWHLNKHAEDRYRGLTVVLALKELLGYDLYKLV